MDNDNIKFTSKIFKTGGSLAVIVKPELLSFLELEEGSDVIMIADVSKKGKYIAFWKVE